MTSGPAYLLRGYKLMLQPGIRRFVVIPLLINIILFTAAIMFGYQQFGLLMDWLLGYLPSWLAWLQFLLWPVFAITAILVLFFTFSTLANLVGAPFNGLLAEAVENHLLGKADLSSSSWKKLVAGAIPAILSELRKMAYYLIRVIPLLILFLIPGINLIAPVLWALFTAWMYALEYLDYPMDNHDILFREMQQQLRKQRALSLSFGGSVLIATMIPFLNFLIMPAAVCGASAMWVDRFRHPITD